MTRETPEKPDRRSRVRRILEWMLPHPYMRLMPELKEFGTARDREKAFKKAYHVAIELNPRAWLLMVGCLAVGLMSYVDPFGFHQILGLRGNWLILTFCCFLYGLVLLLPLVFRSRFRRSLRRQLFEQGRLICIECGYNLTGNNSGRCPECGWQIERGDGLAAGPNHDGRSGANKTELDPGVGRHGR